MSGILVSAGPEISMAEADDEVARIDLNLNLAPPWSPDFLGLRSGSLDDPRPDNDAGRGAYFAASRRILPRFGPGIHGVFLDLHHDLEPQPDQSAFAQLRGVSPFSSSPSHEQALPLPPLAAQDFSQETVEQIYDHDDVETGFRWDEDLRERHGFRRYTRPLTTAMQVERLEPLPSRLDESSDLNVDSVLHLESPFARLVDAVKEVEAKEGSSSRDREGEGGVSGNFECNVCLDMAVDPVLTSCGHLFCWPCLYRWLYVHSEDEECPVCKGAVGESDIVPIYGRGCKTACTSQATSAEDSVVVPPRPHARRRESLRQRCGSWLRSWDWDVDRIGEVDRDEARTVLLRSNEMMRVRRAFHLLEENLQGTLHSRLRAWRRMADRRERFRSPAAEAASSGTAALHHRSVGIHEFSQRRVNRLSGNLQEGVVRSLNVNGAHVAPQVAEPLASLRARVSNRAASNNSFRSVLATISGSAQDDILIPSLSSNPSSSHTVHGASGVSVPEEASSVQRVDIPREANEGTGDQYFGQERPGAFMTQSSEAQSSRSSGYTDVGGESSRCRKRRRLN